MSFVNRVFVRIFNKFVGSDEFGNKYYESSGVNYLNKTRRYVIYKGVAEPSKVPPLWHAWLHHLSDEIPDKDKTSFIWQKAHIPNLTGTKFAALPLPESKFLGKYKKWQPK